MSENNNKKYKYPVEELDKIIEQIQQGIMPMLDEDMETEVELRYKELTSDEDDEDDDDIDSSAREKNQRVSQKIESERRKASRDIGFVIPINEDQKKQIKEEMSVSIVRSDPNSSYNYTDEQGQISDEYKKISQKLSSLKNCYYNPIDYKNAINIIKEAIEYSLEHDHPMMSKEEAIKAFNRGEIKFTYCNIPKLFIGYTKELTDPNILKGIVTGEITMVENTNNIPKHRKSNSTDKPVHVDYEIIDGNVYTNMVDAYTKGSSTPIDAIIDVMKSRSFNRFLFTPQDKDESIPLFDWAQDDAARKYLCDVYKKEYYTIEQMIADINRDNNMELNNELSVKFKGFMNSMKNTSTTNTDMDGGNPATMIKVNPKAEMLEQRLLQSIKINQPKDK